MSTILNQTVFLASGATHSIPNKTERTLSVGLLKQFINLNWKSPKQPSRHRNDTPKISPDRHKQMWTIGKWGRKGTTVNTYLRITILGPDTFGFLVSQTKWENCGKHTVLLFLVSPHFVILIVPFRCCSSNLCCRFHGMQQRTGVGYWMRSIDCRFRPVKR